MEIVIAVLRRSVPASVKVSRNAVAASCGQALHRLYNLVEDKCPVVRAAETLFGDPSSPIYGQVSMEVIDHEGKSGFFARRAGCCLVWRTREDNGYCSNCILQPTEEQTRQFKKMLERVSWAPCRWYTHDCLMDRMSAWERDTGPRRTRCGKFPLPVVSACESGATKSAPYRSSAKYNAPQTHATLAGAWRPHSVSGDGTHSGRADIQGGYGAKRPSPVRHHFGVEHVRPVLGISERRACKVQVQPARPNTTSRYGGVTNKH